MKWLTRIGDYIYEHLRGIYLVLLVIIVLSVSILLYLVYHLNNESHKRAAESIELAQQIQLERRANVIRGCVDTNERHNQTIDRLEVIYNKAAKKISEATDTTDLQKQLQLKQLRDGQKRTVFIIDSLVPLVENCDKVADRAVGTG